MIINKKVQQINEYDYDKLFVIMDFDKTITSDDSSSSWAILAEGSNVSESYTERRNLLYNKYRPIELDENMEPNVKCELMKEWFESHLNLFIEFKLHKNLFTEVSSNLSLMKFRPGAKEFLTFLNDKNIPIIIISAGVGNFIESFLISNNMNLKNIHICSNMLLFKNDLAIGFKDNIIHSMNKNTVIHLDEIQNKIIGREKAMLFGDQISDLKMAPSLKELITVGFYILNDDTLLNSYINAFDIVCTKEDDYNSIRKVLFK